MTPKRLFIDQSKIKENEIYINGEDFHYLIHVLRLKEDNVFNVFDGKGRDIKAKIVKIDKNNLTAVILEEKIILSQSNISIDIAQALPKKDKMDLIIEKATELGARNIFPFISERTIPKLDRDKEAKRIKRWEKIAKSASIQSKRNNVPKIMDFISLNGLIGIFDNYDLIIIPWEEEKEVSLKQILKQEKDIKNILIVIGPEGGFDKEEVKKLESKEVRVVSLGKRILRTETVALAMLSIINYELGLS